MQDIIVQANGLASLQTAAQGSTIQCEFGRKPRWNNTTFDLLVIGGGSGGVRAARMAAQRGVTRGAGRAQGIDGLGGTCVNLGCIPKKLYAYAAGYADAFQESHGYGWQGEAPSLTGACSSRGAQPRSVASTASRQPAARLWVTLLEWLGTAERPARGQTSPRSTPTAAPASATVPRPS